MEILYLGKQKDYDINKVENINMLSKRETEVIKYMINGLRNIEIAETMFVTEKTVKFHITNIYKKFKVKSRSEFMSLFIPENIKYDPLRSISEITAC